MLLLIITAVGKGAEDKAPSFGDKLHNGGNQCLSKLILEK